MRKLVIILYIMIILNSFLSAENFNIIALYPTVITPNGDGFNDMTFIRIETPYDIIPSGKVYDITGAYVCDIEVRSKILGIIDMRWDGRDFNGEITPPGIYIYQIEGGGQVYTGTIVQSIGYWDLTNISLSARQSGMGNTYAAILEGACNLFSNPAGLAFLKDSEMVIDYNAIQNGMTDNSNIGNVSLAYAQPLRLLIIDCFSIGYYSFNVIGVLHDSTYVMGLGKKLSSSLGIGVNFKFSNKYIEYIPYAYDDSGMGLSNPDPTLEKMSVIQEIYSTNISILCKLSERYSTGLVIHNANQPNLGIDNDMIIPIEYRLGFARSTESSIVALDIDLSQMQYSSDLIFAFGIKKSVSSGFDIRLGLQNHAGTIGTSFKLGNFNLDYAINSPFISGSISHQCSISKKF